MQTRSRQLGAGLWGMLYLLGTMGLFLFVFFKVYPIYMNELNVVAAVRGVAAENPDSQSAAVRLLDNRWDIDDIKVLTPAEVQMASRAGGKALVYDYWYQVELLEGVYLSFNFKGEYPLGGAKY